MCGITGQFHRSGTRRELVSETRAALATLRHRGPDQFGIYADPFTALGNARLSIVDISGGQQPIATEDENLWIVFNGEVFNHVELRKDLEALGHRFATKSDTEVVLHLYAEFGPGFLDQLNGQFAIAIWDRTKRQLFLARDRLGVRPLFYTTAGSGIFFASEIKALLVHPEVRRELDPLTLNQIFTFWSPLSPRTAFRDIQELPPGHYLVANEKKIEVTRYWDVKFPEASGSSNSGRRFEECVEEFRTLLTDAVKIRMQADVPVGAYLSGGLDSSTIASVARQNTSARLETFSIAFSDQDFDESPFQQQMAAHLGTHHHVVHATHEDIGKAFPAVIRHAESPLLRTSPAPMFLLSRLARDHGFKVVLTGEGADEFLGGYDIFKETQIRHFWARQPDSKWRPLLLRRLYPEIPGIAQNRSALLEAFFRNGLTDVADNDYSHAIRWRNTGRTRRFFSKALKNEIEAQQGAPATGLRYPEAFRRWGSLERAQFLEIEIFLSQYLLSSQGDRMGMANSVEGRFPFLDYRVVEFCCSLPPRYKLQGLKEKQLLRAAATKWLPTEVTRRRKRPYRAPIHKSFINDATPDYVRELLSPRSINQAGFFNAAAVDQLVAKVDQGKPIGETDDMALAGILSTQLLWRTFLTLFDQPRQFSELDNVKLCLR